MTIDEALSMIDEQFLKVLSEELVKVFWKDIFNNTEDEDIEEFMFGPPIFYLEGTVGWVNAFKIACRKTKMNQLSDWYYDLDWIKSDEFDGELAETLICFNTQNSNAIEEIRTKIDDLSSELGDREEVEM